MCGLDDNRDDNGNDHWQGDVPATLVSASPPVAVTGPLTEAPTVKGAGSVTEDSSRAEWLQQARSHLHDADPVLARLIDDRPAFDPRAWMTQLPPMDLYGALLFQVTGQQLSVAATRRTLARIEALFGGHLPSPAELLGADPGKLREAGLSWLDHLPAQQEVLDIAEKWRPYRSLATSYLFSAAFERAETPPGRPARRSADPP